MLVHDDDVSEGKEKVYWIVILFDDETVERMNERETALFIAD